MRRHAAGRHFQEAQRVVVCVELRVHRASRLLEDEQNSRQSLWTLAVWKRTELLRERSYLIHVVEPTRVLELTADDFRHAAGGVDAADVFGVGGVGVVPEQERCAQKQTSTLNRSPPEPRPGLEPAPLPGHPLCWLMSMRKEMRLV